MKRKYRKSQKIFLLLIIIEIILIIVTPFLNIKFWGLSEESSETVFISFQFLLIVAFLTFYNKEIDKYKKQQAELEDRLRETFKYIGSINLQLEEMKKVFSSVNKYPENKKDIQALFVHSAERILGIINADWVLLRMIDKQTKNTLHEYFISRGNKKVEKLKVENSDLLNEDFSSDKYSVVKSNQDNFNIKAYCILPVAAENSNQKFLLSSITNQLEMLFIIFNSLYYKKDGE